MSKTTRPFRRLFLAFCLSLICFLLGRAEASIIDVTGEGALQTAGQTISGQFQVDGTYVGYDLELISADLGDSSYDSYVSWNGEDRSTSAGLSWGDGGASWEVQFNFTRPINAIFSQNGGSGWANEHWSEWTINWDDPGDTRILDPDNQLDNKSTGDGTATFSISSRLTNSSATWTVEGPASSGYTISWENTSSSGIGTDAFGFDTSQTTLAPIPEPSSAALVTTGLGVIALGALFARRRGVA